MKNEISHSSIKNEIFWDFPEVEHYYHKELVNNKISRQLNELRKKKNITQLELAKKANTTQSVIARIESWNQNISMKTLQKLLLALGATISLELEK